MILNNAVNVGNFIYCMFYTGPNETTTYLNDGHGHFHQAVYVVDGKGVGIVNDLNGNEIVTKSSVAPGELDETLLDTKGTMHTIKTKESSLTFVAFNPIPDTRKLAFEVLKGPIEKTITASEKRLTVVCITGPISANDKQLQSLQFAKVFPGKSADLSLSENTVCILVSDSE
jgi:hypothetical protein